MLKTVPSYEIAVVIEGSQIEKLKDRKRFSVILFVDSIESFNKFFAQVSTDKFKLRRFFTVVLMKPFELFELEMIHDSFWSILVKNVNIIMPSETCEVNLYTFVIFNEGKCGDTKPVKINTFDKDLNVWLKKKFHPKKTQNLHDIN